MEENMSRRTATMSLAVLLLLPLLPVLLHAQDIDSTALLFDDSIVHEFNIHFYYPDYEDSLTYWYEHGEEYTPARIEYRGLVFDSVGVRYKGNSSYTMSRNTPKKPMKFKFDEYQSKKECFDVETLNFSNATKDPTFLREKICYDIIGTRMPAPRTAYAALKIDGDLLGLYTMVEQVDKKFLKRHFPDNDFNLYKASDEGATLMYRGGSAEDYNKEFELKTNEDENDWSRFIEMVRLLNSAPDASFRDQLSPWMAFESAIQMLAFNMVMSNFDSYTGSGRNFYIYDDQAGGQHTFIPWDINEGFGSYPNNWNVFTQDVLNVSNLARRPLNRRVLADDVLRARYLRAIAELVGGAAHEDSVAAAIARLQPLIDPWVRADQYKLYTYQQFLDNMTKDVVVGINMPVPGLLRFSRDRNSDLRQQLLDYAAMSSGDAPAAASFAATAWPNPATAAVTVSYALSSAGAVTATLHDALGRELRRVDAGMVDAGEHALPFETASLPAGVYLYRIAHSASGVTSSATGRLTVLR
jgi:hypothetical protein